MSSRLRTALIILTVGLTGCGGAPSDIRQRIATFQELANSGRFAEIARDFADADRPAYFEKSMGERAKLGRMIRTAEVETLIMSGHGRTGTVVQHNTEFERGYALETFTFLTDEAGARLTAYRYGVGTRLSCPLIPIFHGQCTVEEVPIVTTSAR